MTKHNHPRTIGERMTADDRIAYIRKLAKSHRLSHKDLALFTGYSRHSVAGWFTDCDSLRYREVPARALDRLLLELRSGNVNCATSVGGERHVSLLSAV